MMTELTDHEGYRLIENEYNECLLDYVILRSNGAYRGEESHREAVVTAFKLSTPFKNVIFRRNGMSFFAGQHTGVYSLNH